MPDSDGSSAHDDVTEERALPRALHGRGTAMNPDNRFREVSYRPDPEAYDPDEAPPATRVYRDASSTILTKNDSPDVPFDFSVNPYRGCEHGCVYCYARPYHEYLGFSLGLDFETKILVKEDAPELLRAELAHPRWTPQLVAFSGVTDCYQPLERTFRLTRRCLEVMAEFRNPAGVITKNALVTRDADVLAELARYQAAVVSITVTTLDVALASKLEPRASRPQARLDAIAKLAAAGIPVNVMVAPIVPGLTDHEIPRILKAAKDAGARSAGYVVLRLPHQLKDLFAQWLTDHAQNAREKVLHRIERVRGGALNDPRFGVRMRGEGIFADEIEQLFRIGCAKAGLVRERLTLETKHFRVPGPRQSTLF
jgi:DNA repair photolyase